MSPRDVVLALAASGLRNYRPSRCRDDDRALQLAAFAAPERETITSLYATLGDFRDALGVEAVMSAAQRLAFRDRLSAVLGSSRGGAIFTSHAVNELVAEALHDIRGGAMTALLLGMTDVATAARRGHDDSALLALVRDQRKIIRSVVKDVDPVGRERDALMVPHSLADLAASLSSFSRLTDVRALVLDVHRDADAVVAESCLEFAMLERAVFNLLNNAARHADADPVDVWLDPVAGNARVAVINHVSRADAEKLREVLATNSACLYTSFTTTGSGLGLGIVAEIVGSAYGLSETDELVAEEYVGTQIVDGSFVTWLHWPLSM